MDNKVVRYLIFSQLSLYVFLAVCVVIMPTFVFNHNEGGASNYGVHRATVIPYTLGFFASSLCIVQAGRLMPKSTRAAARFRWALYVLAALQGVVLVTTYSYKSVSTVYSLHVASAALIFCLDTGLTIWMAAGVLKDKLSSLLLIAELAGFILAYLSFFGNIHLLFAAQVITGLAFGWLLIRAADKLT